jgi:hypothetical protein
MEHRDKWLKSKIVFVAIVKIRIFFTLKFYIVRIAGKNFLWITR